MVNNSNALNSTQVLTISTDEIFRGGDDTRCLSNDLDNIDSNITALQNGKASVTHIHSDYMPEDEAIAAFAPINHTHSEYLTSTHSHPELESLIEALDTDKADINHTHTDLSTAIEALDTGKANVNHT